MFKRSVLAIALISTSLSVAAAEVSKEECVDAHGRGQDARDQNKLSLARKLFLSCAQSACPALIQGDCARFADDLGRQQPTLTFAARDSSGADLPDTAVYVDDMLIVTRLDDGKPHDADPGKHTVKFQNAGREKLVTIVLNNGEKGRSVIATFDAPGGAPPPATAVGGAAPPLPRAEPRTTHPTGAKVLIIGGAVALAAGAALGVYGLVSIPSECSLGDHTCTATPGSAPYDDASSSVRNANIGFIVGGVGLAAVIGGLVWYAKGGATERDPALAAMPWLSSDGGGFAVSGRL